MFLLQTNKFKQLSIPSLNVVFEDGQFKTEDEYLKNILIQIDDVECVNEDELSEDKSDNNNEANENEKESEQGNENEAEEKTKESQYDELEALTVKELKAKCKEMGISGYSKLKEEELINLILENME
ncbi:Rho termination factor N-terminal domain-containing protein [Alkalibacillus sp. S2W]|uniref:Rho termination factor N-terminal domain-containing protein n=1 Tax=Alkalibacillus sp. S2W TaxID=3386553 RepID=UPI00398CE505